MAVTRRKSVRSPKGSKKSPETIAEFIQVRIKNLWTKDLLYKLFLDPSYTWLMGGLLIIIELVLNLAIIRIVKYTEIDWSTYMEQVECFLNGTIDYTRIEGATGPLVYPAGHLYIYTLFYFITNRGTAVLVAQHIFAALYLLNLVLVFRIYSKLNKVPPYVLIFMCCSSYRIHSIFVLRLFNDPVAMVLFYLALNLFLDGHWSFGSFVYSLSVSVKMNILLFAPALLLIFLERGSLRDTVKYLTICATTQIALASPFLVRHPLGYMSRAFNLGRVFMYEWTVNWRLVPEELFVSRPFHLALLLCHLVALLAFQWRRWRALLKWLPRRKNHYMECPPPDRDQCANITLALFTANFVGVAFARSLHYQFYVWYFHSLPCLLWFTDFAAVTKLCLLGLVELCWNTFPSTAWSSGLLHAVHFLILCGLYKCQLVSLPWRKA